MIPVLYRKGLTTFTSLGIGPLPDTIECTVREERNGQYELEMRYPVTGLHYKDIEVGKIIRVRNAYCGLQPFDIYAISRPMNGVVTINAKHASYRLNKMVLNPCSGTTAASAMVAIGSHITYGPEAFTFWTDKTTQADWSTLVPVSVRAALGGTEGSVLDVYGGEFEWDNFVVKLHGSRGTDTGVTIKYGKNLLDIVAEENVAERFTACVPFYKARDDSVTIGSVVKTAEWNVIDNYIAPMDLTQYYEPPEGAADNWHPTTAQLQEKAQALMTANAVSRIAQNLTVKFALLSQSAEYANLAALERVKLCDTVTVQHPGLGVDVKLKVIATTWNVLLDRYDDIELGQPKATLSQTIIGDLAETFATLAEELADKVDWTHMDEAIENATNLLTGGTGGYVVIGRNAAGQPNEIFIMDQPDTTQAVSVIRLNKNGIGFSTQGINGPYTNAWTIDGHLVADFMDTGTLSATIIKAGVLSDPNGNFILDLPTGTMTMKKGSINIANKFKVGTDGKATMKDATFTGASRLGYHPYIGDGKIALVDNNGYNSVLIEEGATSLYGLDGTLYGRIKARDPITYTTRFGLELWSNNHVVVNAPNLIFEKYMSIVSKNQKCGINEDAYGVALFNQNNNSNCFIRCNPGGSITISAPGHVNSGDDIYVNGYKVITRADINVYTDGTIKWKEYD